MSINPVASNPSPAASILGKRMQDQNKALASLASGKRLNSAADNAAAMQIALRLQAQLGGDAQASANVEQANALAQTADAGLEQTQALLDRMRNLALQSANTATMDPSQAAALNDQFNDLSSALDRVASDTSFGGSKLLDGSYTGKSVQTGDAAGQSVQVDISSTVTGTPGGYGSQGLGLAGASLSSPAAASDALARIDVASQAVGAQRNNLGSLQSDTLQSLASSLAEAKINLADANSTVSDTDYGQATADLVKNQILNNAGIAMRAQGNISASRVLQLLQG